MTQTSPDNFLKNKRQIVLTIKCMGKANLGEKRTNQQRKENNKKRYWEMTQIN